MFFWLNHLCFYRRRPWWIGLHVACKDIFHHLLQIREQAILDLVESRLYASNYNRPVYIFDWNLLVLMTLPCKTNVLIFSLTLGSPRGKAFLYWTRGTSITGCHSFATWGNGHAIIVFINFFVEKVVFINICSLWIDCISMMTCCPFNMFSSLFISMETWKIVLLLIYCFLLTTFC